jgi:hypothetical protein
MLTYAAGSSIKKNSFSEFGKLTFASAESASVALRRKELAAAREGDDMEGVRALAKQDCVFSRWISGEDELDEKDEYTQLTPLFTHCLIGNTLIVKTLLQAGAAATTVNDQGHTPLLWAVEENRWELAVAITEVLAQFKDLVALNFQNVSLLMCRGFVATRTGHTHTFTHTLAQKHTDITCTHTHTNTHTHTHTHTHISVHIRTCIHTYIHIYIYCHIYVRTASSEGRAATEKRQYLERVHA